MSEQIDPELLAKCIHVAKHWRTDSYVFFSQRAEEWVRQNLQCDPRLVAQQMHVFLAKGGQLKRIRESGNAEDYANEFHDDLVFDFRGWRLYVETIFFEDVDADGCYITVVNVHEAT